MTSNLVPPDKVARKRKNIDSLSLGPGVSVLSSMRVFQPEIASLILKKCFKIATGEESKILLQKILSRHFTRVKFNEITKKKLDLTNYHQIENFANPICNVW